MRCTVQTQTLDSERMLLRTVPRHQVPTRTSPGQPGHGVLFGSPGPSRAQTDSAEPEDPETEESASSCWGWPGGTRPGLGQGRAHLAAAQRGNWPQLGSLLMSDNSLGPAPLHFSP